MQAVELVADGQRLAHAIASDRPKGSTSEEVDHLHLEIGRREYRSLGLGQAGSARPAEDGRTERSAAERLVQPRNRRRLREGQKQFLFRVGDPKPLKGVIHFPEDPQLVRRFVPQDLIHACHAEDHVAGDHQGAPGTGPEGIQPDHLSDSGGSELDLRHITQVGELAKVPREAWVGGQSTYVCQKLAIRQYAPSAG